MKTLVEMLILQFSEDNLRGTAKFISLNNYHRREERKKYQINDIGFILFLFLRFALFFKIFETHSHLFWTKKLMNIEIPTDCLQIMHGS